MHVIIQFFKHVAFGAWPFAPPLLESATGLTKDVYKQNGYEFNYCFSLAFQLNVTMS